MGCLQLEIEGQSCFFYNVDQGLMKSRQIDLLDRMTKKKSQKKHVLIVFPHSDVTRNLSANNPRKSLETFWPKLSAFHCYRSKAQRGLDAPKMAGFLAC